MNGACARCIAWTSDHLENDMYVFLVTLAVWLPSSIVVGLFLGRVIALGNPDRSMLPGESERRRRAA